MSTEHQQYSTANQIALLAKYAEIRGITIVRTYEDLGKSGIRLTGRPALKQLITDVVSGNADFDTILVYDVSRWGRFQDADEGAHYEFLCREAGITIQYCAEQFENDGSLSATIIKSMKRAMAGEFSRELSKKVHSGQCRLASLGFRQGGPPGFALRRVLLDRNGTRVRELKPGEYKNLQIERVILVPGTKYEVDTVRKIFRMFIQERLSEKKIAAALNDSGIYGAAGRLWKSGTVHEVLTNEKYVGNNVYNRTSFKLKQRFVKNPPSQWLRSDGAFEPVIEVETFRRAEKIIADRARPMSDTEMLERLASLLKRNGSLSADLIDASDDILSTTSYIERFGTLTNAYRLIGHYVRRSHRNQSPNMAPRCFVPGIASELMRGVERLGGEVTVVPDSDLLKINGEFTVSIVVTCSLRTGKSLRWKLRLDAAERPDISIVARLGDGNRNILDYFLLPSIEFKPQSLRLCGDNGTRIDRYRCDTLDQFFELCGRQTIDDSNDRPVRAVIDATGSVSPNRPWLCAIV
jgi:DNA invertase Pin-like site-specific DNA recombinase